MEQTPEWRKSGDLKLYKVDEHDNGIFIDSSQLDESARAS
jgi:hypothetical protein